jgi:hypothetical protein
MRSLNGQAEMPRNFDGHGDDEPHMRQTVMLVERFLVVHVASIGRASSCSSSRSQVARLHGGADET